MIAEDIYEQQGNLGLFVRPPGGQLGHTSDATPALFEDENGRLVSRLVRTTFKVS